MSAAAVLVIAVAIGEAASATTTALVATTAEALGRGTSIRVLEVATPFQVEAGRFEREFGAGAVVALTWTEPAHLHASLRLHVARTDSWTTRAISFSEADKLQERARALGLTIATMWPDSAGVPSPSAPAATTDQPPATPATRTPAVAASPPASAAAPSPVARAVVDQKEADSQATGRPSAAGPIVDATAVASPRARAPWAVGVSAIGAPGLGGGLGAAAAAAWFWSRTFALRVGVGMRGGSIAALPGSELAGSAGAGVEWWPARFSSAGGWGLGLRADALVLGQRVGYTGAAGGPDTLSRVMPGADALVQGKVELSPRIDLRLGVGIEVAAGNTELRAGAARETRATIPAAHAIAELGFTLGF